MKKLLLMLLSHSIFSFGQVGVNVDTPSSTLDVSGSIEGDYTEFTDDFSLTALHHSLSFNGNTNKRLTLPSKSLTDNSSLDFSGRKYYIKNNSSSAFLEIFSTSDLIRFGGEKQNRSSVSLIPGGLAIITSNNHTTGWDIDIIKDLKNPDTWYNYYIDTNSRVNIAQQIFFPTNNPIERGVTGEYIYVENSDINAVVPESIVSNVVNLTFSTWGEIGLLEAAVGSLRYRIKIFKENVEYSTINDVWLTSYSVPFRTTGFYSYRFNSPIMYSLKNLAPGNYTFKLEVAREGELPANVDTNSGPILNMRIWGIQSRSEVLVKF